MNVQNDRPAINEWLNRVSDRWQTGFMEESELREEISHLEQAVDDLRKHTLAQDNYQPEELRIRYFKYQLSWANPGHQMRAMESFFANLAKVVESIFK